MKLRTLSSGLLSLALALSLGATSYAVTSYDGTVVEPESNDTTYNLTADSGDEVTLSGLGSGTGTLSVTFANGTSGSFEVVESSSRPAGASVDPEGTVSLFFDITPSGFTNDDIASAVWTFTVTKTWLANNGVTAQNIFLQHWNGSSWERLPTREVSSTATDVTFEADVTSFSPFAVTAVPGLTNTGSPVVLGIVLGVGILSVIGGTFYLSRRNSARQ